METPKKNTYDRENYLKNKDAIYKSIRKYVTKDQETKEKIAELKKKFYQKKKDDPEYKKKHSDSMKKYYQKRKLLKIEQEKLKEVITDKEIEETAKYIFAKIQLHENK
jgi:hypothetical protein